MRLPPGELSDVGHRLLRPFADAVYADVDGLLRGILKADELAQTQPKRIIYNGEAWRLLVATAAGEQNKRSKPDASVIRSPSGDPSQRGTMARIPSIHGLSTMSGNPSNGFGRGSLMPPRAASASIRRGHMRGTTGSPSASADSSNRRPMTAPSPLPYGRALELSRRLDEALVQPAREGSCENASPTTGAAQPLAHRAKSMTRFGSTLRPQTSASSLSLSRAETRTLRSTPTLTRVEANPESSSAKNGKHNAHRTMSMHVVDAVTLSATGTRMSDPRESRIGRADSNISLLHSASSPNHPRKSLSSRSMAPRDDSPVRRDGALGRQHRPSASATRLPRSRSLRDLAIDEVQRTHDTMQAEIRMASKALARRDAIRLMRTASNEIVIP